MIYDCIVIGASAAGLMSAITAKSKGGNVLILEGQKKPGAKILMSGGTRCNVTNKLVTDQDYESEHKRFVKHVLAAFPGEKTIQFFEALGVRFVCEKGGKYFPTTHSGKTILDALLNKIDQARIDLQVGRRVKVIKKEKNYFSVEGDQFSYQTKTVVLCTGGLSYPSTGSDGVGYKFAKQFGHSIVETLPALTPLTTHDPMWKSISGVALPCQLTLKVDGKKEKVCEGDFLFTHLGFSGPVALDISRHWLKASRHHQVEMMVNWLPGLNGSLDEDVMLYAKKFPKRLIKTYLIELLPERFVEIILGKMNIKADLWLNQLKQSDRKKIGEYLGCYPLEVAGVVGYSKAEVTAGGVQLNELHHQTMESKLQLGLFFAGEICDVDGRIGGFNFQWAWASGYVAGCGVGKKGKGCD